MFGAESFVESTPLNERQESTDSSVVAYSDIAGVLSLDWATTLGFAAFYGDRFEQRFRSIWYASE